MEAPTRTYLLDNNVLSYFINAERKTELAAVCSVLPLAVVQEVHEEAARHKTRGKEYEKWQSAARLDVRRLTVGGSGALLLGRLRSASNDMKDLGEHASIALAAEDPSLVFVTNDKNASWLALRELYVGEERVRRFWTFLRLAQAAAGLHAAAVVDVARAANLAHEEPKWWAEWVASLPT